MTPIEIRIIDLDFPVGSKNKTATLITGEDEALLVDAGFTRADGHRLVAEILDSGKALTTVFISHADPDFYWGAEVIADAFPDAELVATPLVIEHIQRRLRGQAQGVGGRRRQPAHPPGRARPADRRHHLRGPPLRAQGRTPDDCPTATTSGRPSSGPSSAASCSSSDEHVWTADTATPEQRAAWIAVLDEMEALDPATRRARPPPARTPPPTPAPSGYTRDYLNAFEEELANGGRRRRR